MLVYQRVNSPDQKAPPSPKAIRWSSPASAVGTSEDSSSTNKRLGPKIGYILYTHVCVYIYIVMYIYNYIYIIIYIHNYIPQKYPKLAILTWAHDDKWIVGVPMGTLL